MLPVNQQQKVIIDDWINTSNYVYNKTLEKIKKGHKVNFMSLRDLLVTNNTKKHSDEYKSFDDIIIKLKQEKQIINEKIKKYKLCNLNNKKELIDKLNKELKIKINEIQIINKQRRHLVKNIKSTKNNEINNWELKTPKEIRASAVNDVCLAYKTAFSNLKNNNITSFNLNYRKMSFTQLLNSSVSEINAVVKVLDSKLNDFVKR
jgi:site-specific recombinase XerC